MNSRIAIILPKNETFARDRFGAIALTVEAYVRYSAFRTTTEVLGIATEQPRDPAVFRPVQPESRWWRRRNLAFGEGCAADLAKAPPRHIDVHNRVEVFALLARRFPDAAVSLWFHNDPRTIRGAHTARERRWILDHAHFVFCVSEWVRGRFLEDVGGDAEHVHVMPSPIDGIALPPVPKEPLIVYVGRIMPQKGVLPLANALAQTLPGNLPGWRAAIIGAAPRRDRVYRDHVVAAITPLGDRVTMPGFLSHEETMATLAKAAIAAVPSQWDEPFGRTALEALAAGCAVIASRRGGLPEIIDEAGISIDEPDAPALSAAITRLACDENLRRDLQQRALQRAAEFEARRWAAVLDALRQAADPELLRYSNAAGQP